MEWREAAGAQLAGEFAHAHKLWTLRVLAEPASTWALCNRAACAIELGLLRGALRDADAALKLDQDCTRAAWWKAVALKSLGKPASDICRAVIERGVGDVEIMREMQSVFLGSVDDSEEPMVNAEGSVADKKSAPEEKQIVPTKSSGVSSAPLPDDADVARAVASEHLLYGVGDAAVDKQIALGYFHTNSGHFKQAIMLFSALLEKNNRIVAAYLGRGTALAMSGHLREAIGDFSNVIVLEPQAIEGYKRRGQSLLAMQEFKLALDDLSHCVLLSPSDSDSFQQRGVCRYKMRDFTSACRDFETATRLDPTLREAWNQLGLSLTQTGQTIEAIEAYETALAIDRTNRETHTNLGQAWKELGDFERADASFSQSVKLDGSNFHSYWLRGVARYLAGHHELAVSDLMACRKLNPSLVDARQSLVVAFTAQGRFAEAVAESDVILAQSADHWVWYNRRMAIVLNNAMDEPFASFHLDEAMEASVKDGFSKRRAPRLACPTEYKDVDSPHTSLNGKIQSIDLRTPMSVQMANLIESSLSFGPLFQYQCPGFVVNKRQWLSAGVSILHISESLQADTGRTMHWRSLFDLAVRWRQLSEPNDPVWWVDQLPFVQFSEGYGSHTPIVTGHCTTVRYGHQLPRALQLVKDVFDARKGISDQMQQDVQAASSLPEMFRAVRRDFWVTTPCHSKARPGHILEGTRITLQYGVSEDGRGGYEFSIRTPGTPPRQADFEQELDALWTIWQSTAASHVNVRTMEAGQKILEATLYICFFWYNLMPLSRGTAAIGMIALHALMHSTGWHISKPIPAGFQPDWEAILTPEPAKFVETMSQWILPVLCPVEREGQSNLRAPLVGQVIGTLRDAVYFLNSVTQEAKSK